jgi:hypothetical protein
MERVVTLSNLLAEKLQNKAGINELLSTVKMIESELLHLKNITPPQVGEHVNANALSSLQIAKQITIPAVEEINSEIVAEEKIVEVLQIDEAEVEAELEEIKKHVQETNAFSFQNRPAIVYDEIEELPTFANRQAVFAPEETRKNIKELNEILPVDTIEDKKELNEILPTETATSLNEILAKPTQELSESLQEQPVKDLKKAIGVNDKFLYLNELFRGDEAMYERSIKTINAFNVYPEAELWIRRELKLKLGWDDNYQTVKQFDQLVRRRFA